jgi:hypothetical protein
MNEAQFISAAVSVLGALADLARANGQAAAEARLRKAMSALQTSSDAVDAAFAKAHSRAKSRKK